MSVTVLDGQTPYRLTLASPAEVDGSGTVVVTPANLGASGGPGEFTSLSVDGDLAVGGAINVGGTTAAQSGDVVIGDALTVTGLLTGNGGATIIGDVIVGGGGTTTTPGLAAGPGGNWLIVDEVSGAITLLLQTFADNAAAVLGGLVVGNVYQTATGELRIVV